MGNCLFLRARGWGIDRQVRTKLQIPGGMPGGGMVTSRIEPCINPLQKHKKQNWSKDRDNLKSYSLEQSFEGQRLSILTNRSRVWPVKFL